MTLQRLVLVKHSLPEILPDVPAREWRLNDEGRLRCRALAERLKPYGAVAVVASVEPKAWETGAIVAQRLAVPCEAVAGLHEHDRSGVPFGTADAFQRQVANFFDWPDELVFGQETAAQAEQRFRRAVETAIAKWSDPPHWSDVVRARAEPTSRSLVVVAHGTVITLLVAAWFGVEPYAFWQSLGLPSFVVLSLPGHELIETVLELS